MEKGGRLLNGWTGEGREERGGKLRAGLTGLEEVEAEVVLLRVVGVHGPPVVDEDVEAREEEDQEGGRPLGLEADDDLYEIAKMRSADILEQDSRA